VTLRTPIFLLLPALFIAGCKHSPAPAAAVSTPAAAPAPPIAPPTDRTTAGSIIGSVHFNGTAPARIPIDMSADPACTKGDLPNLTEQLIVTDGLLANVYIYIKSGAPSYSTSPTAVPITLNQNRCRYSPHVIAIQRGGSVAFLNSDATIHNIHTIPTQPGNASVDISEPAGSAPRTEAFPSPEVMLPVRCNNHPWMSAFINIAPNPWFAVTGTEGAFTITGLPPGTYTLAAVHEKLGEQDMQITIAPKSVATASFTFSAK
jgi:plastocyanin